MSGLLESLKFEVKIKKSFGLFEQEHFISMLQVQFTLEGQFSE